MGSSVRHLRLLAVLLAVALVGAACSGSSGSDDPASTTVPGSPDAPTDPDDPGEPLSDVVRIEVLSSQPDRITGDDALIKVTPSSDGSPGALRVELDGTDVTSAFTEVDGALEGVVVGLVEGANALTVSGDGEPVTLRLRAWPLQGPMISGPQPPLLVCSTITEGLGAADGPDCAADPKITFRYVTTSGDVAALPDPSDLPGDAAMVEADGVEHPAIVRVERGVLNRFPYVFAVIVAEADDDPDAPVAALWNRRNLHSFGEGCGATHGQGALGDRLLATGLPTAELEGALLLEGWALSTSTGNEGAIRCNDVVSAETTMMIQERATEVLGVPDHTIGVGSGAGGAQVHLITQNYPDVLDGGVTVAAYPDVVTLGNDIADCMLLAEYFDGPGSGLDAEARRAITGDPSDLLCNNLAERFGTPFDPTTGCDPEIPVDRIWSPTNPTGIRCTVEAINAAPYGITAESASGTQQVTRPIDNEGVQYGLGALNDGVIDFDEFLDLNRSIGGLDADGAPVPERMAVDPMDLARVYETGRVSAGTGDQARVPIIDLVAAGSAQSGEPGNLLRAVAFHDRILRLDGLAAGHSIWAVPEPQDRLEGAIGLVDEWVAAIAEGSGATADSARPDGAESRCSRDGADSVVGADVFDVDGRGCREEEVGGTARTVAGAHRTLDVIRCQLKWVDPADYAVPLTGADIAALEDVFPTGVCDWAYFGAGQTVPAMPDRTFADEDSPATKA